MTKQLNTSRQKSLVDKAKAIKDWPEDERPRERLVKYGVSTLSDAHLFAILLRTGDHTQNKSALDLARMFMDSFSDFDEMDSASVAEMCKLKGIGLAKACQLKAAFEIGKRMTSQIGAPQKTVKTSRDVVNKFMPFMKNMKKEQFKAVLLDGKNKIIKDVIISEGDLTSSIVHPREVFKPAIKDSAASVIFIHNHPSGDPKPSDEDVKITTRLMQAGEIVGIEVLDHIIIGTDKYFSFLDENLL